VWRLTPLGRGGLSGWINRIIYRSTGTSTHRCRTVRDARVRLPCSTAQLSLPPASLDLLVFLPRAFRAIPPCDMFDVRGSSMTMLSPLPLTIISDRTKTFFACEFYCIDMKWLCPLASPEKPIDHRLWPIVSVDEKHYNHWRHGKKSYTTCNKHVSLIHP
jgi:hypothetical protein